MRSIVLTVFLLILTSTIVGQEAIAGKWNTGKENTIIEIIKKDGAYAGFIHSSDNEESPVGKQIVKDLRYDGKKWKAMLYAVKRGQWYDAEIIEKGQELEVKVSVGFMSRTISWSKESE